ncbi:hypothetical protein L1887_25086 [Cichorium endivia]|nr:hypothetical protein L1887_25086 [Cichorium endivia]
MAETLLPKAIGCDKAFSGKREPPGEGRLNRCNHRDGSICDDLPLSFTNIDYFAPNLCTLGLHVDEGKQGAVIIVEMDGD